MQGQSVSTQLFEGHASGVHSLDTVEATRAEKGTSHKWKKTWLGFRVAAILNSEGGILAKFSASIIVFSICTQGSTLILNRGSSANKELLTSFGIAMFILKLSMSWLSDIRECGIVHINSKKSYLKLLTLTLAYSTISFLFIIILASTQAGVYVIERMHNVGEPIPSICRKFLLQLSAIPFIEGLNRIHMGILLRYGVSTPVGLFCIVDVAFQLTIVMVSIFVASNTNVTWISVTAMYVGSCVRLACNVFAFLFKYNREFGEPNQDNPISYKKIILFLLPMNLTELLARLGRPIITLLMIRDRAPDYNESDSITATAGFVSADAIATLCYMWVHETRCVIPRFYGPKAKTQLSWRSLLWFHIVITLLSSIVFSSLFLNAGYSASMLRSSQNLSENVSVATAQSLQMYNIVPLSVGVRTLSVGYLVCTQKHQFLTPAMILRFVVLIIFLVSFPYMGVHGVFMGVGSLTISMVVDTISLLIPFVYWKLRERHEVVIRT